uniref:Uncharacterized protein n=1 Tax=Romanomermis culicivorax TaxID=13658 RepID=A0A915JLT5_ROMCU
MYIEPQPPVSPDVAALILGWVAGLWAKELGVVDSIHTAHFALLLYEAPRLDNPSCLLQAYNNALITVNATGIKVGLYRKNKQGILMLQSALKKLCPFTLDSRVVEGHV